MNASPSVLEFVAGGSVSLGADKARLVQATAGLIRRLPERQALLLFGLLQEFERDGYLERVRGHEPPIVKIFAEVVSGWDEEGAYEFARAWVSTLVAREDDFSWDTATEQRKRRHREQVHVELVRRGVLPPQS